MAYQTQWNVVVAYKAQSGLGTIASGSGGSILPLTGGAGALTKTAIQSAQIRQDGMSVRGRHGTQAVTGQYPGELQLGNYDTLMGAVMRNTWVVPPTITQATAGMSSATMSATGSVVTFSAGSVITAGARFGDVHMWTSGLASADQNRPLRVVGLTATTITYAETLTTVAGPVSTYSFGAKGKQLINAPAGSLVRTYFTIDEYEADTDVSEVYQDCVFSQLDIAMQPNGMLTITPHMTGTGHASSATGASAPTLTTPTLPLTTALPLAAIDATVRLSDEGDILSLTAFSLSINNQVSAPAVAASKYSPDVFDGIQEITASLTFMRQDLIPFTDFLAETQLSLHLLAVVPNSSPPDFLAITVPNLTLGSAQKSNFNRAGGPLTVTTSIPQQLIGVDTRGGAYQQTQVIIQRSTST